jgi:hypothetical protein
MHAFKYRYVSTVCMYIYYTYLFHGVLKIARKPLKGQCIHAVHKDVTLPSLEFSGLCMTGQWSVISVVHCTVQIIYPSTAYSFLSFSLQR